MFTVADRHMWQKPIVANFTDCFLEFTQHNFRSASTDPPCLFREITSNFVHWLAKWSTSLHIDKQYLKWAWLWSRGLLKFWEI